MSPRQGGFALALIVIFSFAMVAYLSISQTFSDQQTIVNQRGERYHVLPESKLSETLVITDEQGKKYCVISEEKLRLLGPKLLTGGE